MESLSILSMLELVLLMVVVWENWVWDLAQAGR
jgi:hypothetical protein